MQYRAQQMPGSLSFHEQPRSWASSAQGCGQQVVGMGAPCLHYGFLTAQNNLLLTFCQNLFQERLFEKTPSQFSLFPIYKGLKEKTNKQKHPRARESKSMNATERQVHFGP